ncbi:VOC family protein [Curtobacterium sp. MCBD17_040]|uniref:VOC family protein n=1 Tax=Curtobacterium sp. MCBD17_040 TaxID=2175674 RepID=UPI000DA79752|nr:VOC family protein [Curtobacterium sp. MCBD17_040]WIB65055.1 VOC family protein [Curtobacterium sp. MCBD17_040]
MTSSMWVSITSADLARSAAFYEALGFPVNPDFSDEHGTCFELADNLHLMVVARDFFATMTTKEIADPRTHAQVGLNLTRDSRDEVDAIVEKGIAAGGHEPQPAQDLGFMYSRDLEDPDGNNLGFLCISPAD